MAKKTQSKPKALTRKQLSRREKESRQQRYVMIGVGAVLVVVVIIFMVGFFVEKIHKPAQPIAMVNGEGLRTDTYQHRVEYSRLIQASFIDRLEFQRNQLLSETEDEETASFLEEYTNQQIEQTRSEALQIPQNVLEDMIEEEIMQQELERRGLTVTEQELESDIQRQIGYDPNPPTPVPTPITATESMTTTPIPPTPPMTLEQFQQEYQARLQTAKEIGLSEKEYRDIYKGYVMRDKLIEEFVKEQPTTAEQVHAYHILATDDVTITKALERLEAGDDFSEVARDLSEDPGSAAQGGDLGWFARGQMVEEFGNVAFSLEPGEVSDVFTTTYGSHIVKVVEKDPQRPLDEESIRQRAEQAFNEWLAEQKKSEGIERFWSAEKVPTMRPNIEQIFRGDY